MMKFIVLFAAFAALASDAKSKKPIAEYFSDFANEPNIDLIIKDDERPPTYFAGDVTKAKTTSINTIQGKGKFNYNFETENGINIASIGKLKDGKTFVVTGSYTYTGADNKRYRVRYTADEFGYHPVTELDDQPEIKIEPAKPLPPAPKLTFTPFTSFNNGNFQNNEKQGTNKQQSFEIDQRFGNGPNSGNGQTFGSGQRFGNGLSSGNGFNAGNGQNAFGQNGNNGASKGFNSGKGNGFTSGNGFNAIGGLSRTGKSFDQTNVIFNDNFVCYQGPKTDDPNRLYLPPKQDYLPPKSDYLPPKPTYLPPV